MSKENPIGLPANSWHHRRSTSKCLRGVNIVSKSRSEVLQAHLYISNNTDEVIPYIDAYKAIVKANNPRQAENWVLMEHNRTFIPWFKDEVLQDSTASETLTWLADGLKFDVISCTAYKVNNCIFYTMSIDEKSIVQNYGVTLEAESMQFSPSKDTNPLLGSIAYYEFIEEIWEVDYTKFLVPVFKCKWVEDKSGAKIDESGFTLVNFQKIGYRDEPFIMVQQASQVFYVKDPTSEHWYVVIHGKKTRGGHK